MSFLETVAPLASGEGAPNPWFSWSYVTANLDTILSALRSHLALTAETILIVSAVLYTIPSLALFAFLAPYTGVTGTTTVLIGLVLYALLLIVRNTLVGLEQVPDEVLDAANGMGYSKLSRLWHVELPLAMPGIISGVRLATVSTVALVTVGVVVGQGGLGQL